MAECFGYQWLSILFSCGGKIMPLPSGNVMTCCKGTKSDLFGFLQRFGAWDAPFLSPPAVLYSIQRCIFEFSTIRN